LHRLADLLAARGVQVSHDTVLRFLRAEGLSFKKTLFASEQLHHLLGPDPTKGKISLAHTTHFALSVIKGANISLRLGSPLYLSDKAPL